jgi:hypothetical protein
MSKQHDYSNLSLDELLKHQEELEKTYRNLVSNGLLNKARNLLPQMDNLSDAIYDRKELNRRR